MCINNIIASSIIGGVMKNVPGAPVGTSSCLSDEPHEPPGIKANVSMAGLGSGSSPSCSLLFHTCREEIVIGHHKTFILPAWDYLHWPIFRLLRTLSVWVHPSCLYGLGIIALESPSRGFSFVWHSLPDCDHPLGDICLSPCVWRGTGPISESEWSGEFAEWKMNMLYPSMHSKCWWRLRFLTKPAVNILSFFLIRLKDQMILKLGGVNFLCKSIQIGSELQPKKKKILNKTTWFKTLFRQVRGSYTLFLIFPTTVNFYVN